MPWSSGTRLLRSGPHCKLQFHAGRRRLLEGLAFKGSAWRTSASHGDGALDGAEACVAVGLEDIVLKHLDSRYEPGKRSRHWVKVKTSSWKTDHAPARFE